VFLHDVVCLWWRGPVYPGADSVGRTFPVEHSVWKPLSQLLSSCLKRIGVYLSLNFRIAYFLRFFVRFDLLLPIRWSCRRVWSRCVMMTWCDHIVSWSWLRNKSIVDSCSRWQVHHFHLQRHWLPTAKHWSLDRRWPVYAVRRRTTDRQKSNPGKLRIMQFSCYTGWPKNLVHFCTPYNFVEYWPVFKLFPFRINRTFVIILSLKILPHLKCVATLPYEMSVY